METLIVQKLWELKRKSESLNAEFASWQEMAAAGEPLEKHHRQVTRLVYELEDMLDVVNEEVKKLEKLEDEQDKKRFLHMIPRTEFVILEVHRTWQFFRAKFLSRQGPPFSSLLEAMDELVWRCYDPVFDDPPEPPLVFFSGEWSPLAMSRRAALKPMPGGGTDAARFGALFDEPEARLTTMVIPLVSLPWYTTTFLPLALLLAHETAHLVDYDLELEDPMVGNLTNVQKNGRQIDRQRLENYWIPWRAEVFADLYGVLVLGPAYASSLELLLSRSENVTQEDLNNHYPPYHLRLQIVLAALEQLKFSAEATELANTWKAIYGDLAGYDLQACEEDIDLVVEALLETPFLEMPFEGQERGVILNALTSIDDLCWNKEKQGFAVAVSERLLQDGDVDLLYNDPRVLMAGVQLAFQDHPEAFAPGGLQSDNKPPPVIKKILAAREPGVRSRDEALEQLPGAETFAKEDRKHGRQIAEGLLALWDSWEEE